MQFRHWYDYTPVKSQTKAKQREKKVKITGKKQTPIDYYVYHLLPTVTGHKRHMKTHLSKFCDRSSFSLVSTSEIDAMLTAAIRMSSDR